MYNQDIHHRRSIRLQGYDYSQAGLYFVTICSYQREPLFGAVIENSMKLNLTGSLIDKLWSELPEKFPQIKLHEYIVMPNHIHGIIEIVTPEGVINHAPTESGITVGAQFIAPCLAKRYTIGNIIRVFKARCTHAVNSIRNTPGLPVWQRNYYEHIIRNEAAYLKIADYIKNNPQKWTEDTYHV